MAIRRTGDYAVDYALVNLDKVAGKTKVMADAFIAPSGSDVIPAFQSVSGAPRISRVIFASEAFGRSASYCDRDAT